jgi:Fic family protein
MLFNTPDLGDRELEVISDINDLAEKLRIRLHEPHRWFGSLRRVQFARAVQGSNSIEGFDAPIDDAAAIELGEAPLDADEETRAAIKGYCDAMTYVLQLSSEPNFHYGEQLLKSLHFMMTCYDLKIRPGLWRQGSIYVRNEESGEIVYEGADLDDVPQLMHELVDELNVEDNCPIIVRAAMAHLNLVMVHPFRDGNGRMARCLQTLVLARNGVLSPVFCSIEEYLGRNTQAYYDVLARVGQGSWNPEGDAIEWVRFILTAHLRQAKTLQRRIRESEKLWDDLERLIEEKSLPYRTINPLYDASMRFRVRNGTYRAILAEMEEEISEQVATRDLKQLTEVGLLIPHGTARGRFYTATPELWGLRQSIIAHRDSRDDSDPFTTAS